MDRFIWRLTEWGRKKNLKFAERQLRKYKAIRSVDYCYKPGREKYNRGQFAIFTTGDQLDHKTWVDLKRRLGKNGQK